MTIPAKPRPSHARFVRFFLTAIVMMAAALGTPPAAAQLPEGSRDEGAAPARDLPIMVEYLVSLTAPQTQMVDMQMTIRGVSEPMLEVALPVWRPGKYQILDPAGTVREVRARSGAGLPLPIEKFEKSAWLVQTDATAGDDTVIVQYRVYANSIADRTRHIDDTHAFLSPSTVFMYAPAYRNLPLRVHVQAPEGWNTATGLERDHSTPGAFIAPDYDVLVDSPLEIGLHDRMTFEVEKIPHEIIVWAPAGLPEGDQYDREQMPRDFAKIIDVQRQIFGDLPYERYVFLIHCYPGGRGGTEHLNSTIMQTSPATFRSKSSYNRFLKLVSHEMFHTWNVKRLRPAGLAPYDYSRENYTHLLWVAEGTTSYYDWLTLVRAGIVSPDEYLRTLSTAIDGLRSRPGAVVQSLEESSFDAWIKFNKPTPDSVNSTISFYDKGAQVSLLLDMEIRARTQNAASLDQVMANLYHEFPLGGPGFTREDFIRAAERITGTSFRRFFDDYISGTVPLEFGILRTAGIEAERPSGERQQAYLGFTLSARDGHAIVSSVLSDGPAYKAGLVVDDQVVTMNGERLTAGELDRLTRRLDPGAPVELTILRHDVERRIAFPASGRPTGRWSLKRVSDPTDSQKQVYESWLGQPWPGESSRQSERLPPALPTEDPHSTSAP